MSDARPTVAVIGAGPKAAALAAWVASWEAMRRTHTDLKQAPRLIIFEKHSQPAAAWVGRFGYTDGNLYLCTESNDIGNGAGPLIAKELRDEFLGIIGEWRYTGKEPQIYHRQYAKYIGEILRNASEEGHVELPRSGEELIERTVTEILPTSSGGWQLSYTQGSDSETLSVHGLVVTGSGPPIQAFRQAEGIGDRSWDAKKYWELSEADRQARLKAVMDRCGSVLRVLIAGCGGAAASVALDICKCLRELYPTGEKSSEIVLVGPQATLYTRGESSWEHEILLNFHKWKELSLQMRREVRERLVSGVVFQRVLAELATARVNAGRVMVEHAPGRVKWIGSADKPGSRSLHAIIDTGDSGCSTREIDLAVSAAGFNVRWFLDDKNEAIWKQPATLVELLKHADVPSTLDSALAVSLDPALSSGIAQADLSALSHLHLPMFCGGSRQPGLASLQCLGEMAERVIARYVHIAAP